MRHKKTVLMIISLMLIFGGIVRLFANETLFEIFGMKYLWIDHNYFLYIYKVLGAFVILLGLIIFRVSKNPEEYLNVLKTIKFGLILIGIVMIISGYSIKLPLLIYAPDFVFCFVIAFYLHANMNYKTLKRNND